MMSTILFKFSVYLMKKLFTENVRYCEHFSVSLFLTGGLVTKLLGIVTNGLLNYKTPRICY